MYSHIHHLTAPNLNPQNYLEAFWAGGRASMSTNGGMGSHDASVFCQNGDGGGSVTVQEVRAWGLQGGYLTPQQVLDARPRPGGAGAEQAPKNGAAHAPAA